MKQYVKRFDSKTPCYPQENITHLLNWSFQAGDTQLTAVADKSSVHRLFSLSGSKCSYKTAFRTKIDRKICTWSLHFENSPWLNIKTKRSFKLSKYKKTRAIKQFFTAISVPEASNSEKVTQLTSTKGWKFPMSDNIQNNISGFLRFQDLLLVFVMAGFANT